MTPVEARTVEALRCAFEGREDVYLLERGPLATWEYETVTPELFARHLRGEIRVGVVPGETATFGCLDFDGKERRRKSDGILQKPANPEGAWAETRRVAEIMDADLGLRPLIERSRSAQGWHVWLFADPSDAPTLDALRRLLRAVLRLAGLPDGGNEGAGDPGIFPHPPGPKGVGRAPYMPWAGLLSGAETSVFVGPNGEPLPDQVAALEGAERLTAARVLAALRNAEAALAAQGETVQASASTPAVSPSSPTTPGEIPTSRHDRLLRLTLKWAALGIPEAEVREAAFALADRWGMLAERRGGEVENIVTGAFLKLQREGKLPGVPAALPTPVPLSQIEAQRPEYSIRPLIQRGGLTQIYGAPGAGKSYGLLAIIAATLSGPGPLFGSDVEIERAYRSVLWLSGEERGPGFRWRWERALRGAGIIPDAETLGIIRHVCTLDPGQQIALDRLPELVARERPELLVVDPLLLFLPDRDTDWNASGKDSGDVSRALRAACLDTGTDCLIIHHANKAGTGEWGSIAWRATCDVMAAFEQVGRPDQQRIKVKFEKVRDGRAVPPFVLAFEHDHEAVRVRLEDDPDAVALTDSEGLILTALRARGETSQAALASLTGLARSTVLDRLPRLEGLGLAKRTGDAEGRSPVWVAVESAMPDRPGVSGRTVGHMEAEK